MTTEFLPREVLAKALNGEPRVVRALEDQYRIVKETEARSVANVDATTELQDATVLTLSPNDTLTNERVVQQGQGITLEDTGTYLIIRIDPTGAASVEGGYPVVLRSQGVTDLIMPISGTLATKDGTETLSAKTLAAPKLSGLGNYANDAAAAAGGVPVGGVYRSGSALMVRVV